MSSNAPTRCEFFLLLTYYQQSASALSRVCGSVENEYHFFHLTRSSVAFSFFPSFCSSLSVFVGASLRDSKEQLYAHTKSAEVSPVPLKPSSTSPQSTNSSSSRKLDGILQHKTLMNENVIVLERGGGGSGSIMTAGKLLHTKTIDWLIDWFHLVSGSVIYLFLYYSSEFQI